MIKDILKRMSVFTICVLCTLVMMLSFNQNNVYADDYNLIVVSNDKKQLSPGDIITYSVDMTHNEDVMAALLTIKYDSTKLEPLYLHDDIEKSITTGTVLSETTYDYNIDDAGNIKIVFVSNSNKISTGNICTISFKVKPDTTGDVGLEMEKCETCNNDALPNSTTVLNKSVATIKTDEVNLDENNISFDKTTINIGIGQSGNIGIIGDITGKNIKWISSDESIVQVDESGKLLAVKSGEAVVKAIIDGKELSCKVIVVEDKSKNILDNDIKSDNTSLGEKTKVIPSGNNGGSANTYEKQVSSSGLVTAQQQSNKVKATKTNDNNMLVLWIIIIAAATLLFVKGIKNIKSKRIICLMIVITMLFTCTLQSNVYADTDQYETTEAEAVNQGNVYDSIPISTLNELKKEKITKSFKSQNACWTIDGSNIVGENTKDFSLEMNQKNISENDNIYPMLKGRYAEKLSFAEEKAWNFNAIIEIERLGQTYAEKTIFIKADDLAYKNFSASGSNTKYSYSSSDGNEVYMVDGTNGDCDGNNKVDKNDAITIMRYLDGKEQLDAVEEGFADIDCNKNVNLADLVRVIKFVDGRSKILFDMPVISGGGSSDDSSSTGGNSHYDGGGSGTGGTISNDYVSGGGKNPSGTTGVSGSDVVEYASQFVGGKYVWGGNSLTSGVDCSGFVHEVYAHFGISTPRYSQAFKSVGQAVSFDNIQPGDVVVYPGHVAIYAGGGVIVEAQSTKAGITKGRSVQCHTILAIRRLV